MSALPAFIRPLVPSTAKAPPKGADWTHEVKWDGYRVVITKHSDRVRIFTRSGAEYSTRLPRMVEAFAKLPAKSALLDGELCYVGADGRAKFYQLMREMRTSSPDESCLMFFAFDLLHENGVDLRGLPLSERRRDLERLCRKARVPFLKMTELRAVQYLARDGFQFNLLLAAHFRTERDALRRCEKSIYCRRMLESGAQVEVRRVAARAV